MFQWIRICRSKILYNLVVLYRKRQTFHTATIRCHQITGNIRFCSPKVFSKLIGFWIFSNPSVTYSPGLSVDAPKRGHQGHPLKSFSVPGPPSSTPLISNTKHTGKTYNAVRFATKCSIVFISSSRDNTTTERIAIQKTIRTKCTDKSFAIWSVGGPFKWWNSTASAQRFNWRCRC